MESCRSDVALHVLSGMFGIRKAIYNALLFKKIQAVRPAPLLLPASSPPPCFLSRAALELLLLLLLPSLLLPGRQAAVSSSSLSLTLRVSVPLFLPSSGFAPPPLCRRNLAGASGSSPRVPLPSLPTSTTSSRSV